MAIHGKPSYAFRFDGGIGDDLLCSAVVHESCQRGHRNIWMLTDYPDLFRRNPNITLVARKTWRGVRRFLEISDIRPFSLNYAPHINGRDVQPKEHVIIAMCRKLGLKGAITKRPYLYLNNQERTFGKFGHYQIAIQSSGLAARYAARTKEWVPGRFQEVADRLKQDFTLVQVGSTQDPYLAGTIDMRGKTSVRQTAGILANSILFIGLAGFLQHLARSVECRSVILYGGRELPSQTGYSCNENLVDQPSCSPCWIYENCDHNVKCMNAISVDMVLAAAWIQIKRFPAPLVEDIEEI